MRVINCNFVRNLYPFDFEFQNEGSRLEKTLLTQTWRKGAVMIMTTAIVSLMMMLIIHLLLTMMTVFFLLYVLCGFKTWNC